VTSAADALDYLSVDDLLEIAEGVLDEVAVRDFGLLSSAAARPQTSVFGSDAYPSFPEKAAALMHSLARNHALIDGNKRLAWAATRVFCLLNGFDIGYQIDNAVRTVLAIAAGEIDVPEIAKWIADQLR
jgi:death on curing protein